MEKSAVKFKKEIASKLKTELKKENVFEVPALEKIVISSGTGEIKEDKNAIEKVAKEITKITGQKATTNYSRKAVSAFKLRIGQPVGITVTLRGTRMYDFLDRLVNIALPRVRDFKGVSKKAFDGHGNYAIGIKDYTIFPEVKFEEVDKAFGLQINIKTTTDSDEEAKALLSMLGVPFEK